MGAAALTEEGTGPSPIVRDDGVTFSLPDQDDALSSVSLLQELQRPRVGPGFIRDRRDGIWRLTFPRPAVDRMEYKLELRHKSGEREVICDPSNPYRAPGAFGDKSVIEFSQYGPPGWIGESDTDHETVDLNLRSTVFRAECTVKLWATPGAEVEAPLPLLVAHDGTEYASLSGLLQFLSVMHERGEVPPMRVGLLPPIRRRRGLTPRRPLTRGALAHEILPAIEEVRSGTSGQEHADRHGSQPWSACDAPRSPVESRLLRGAVLAIGQLLPAEIRQTGGAVPPLPDGSTRFVGTVLSTTYWSHPIPVAMTCGAVEENLLNNLALREALVAQGYDVRFLENRDAHNWVGWRDAFEPALSDLLRMMWT